MLALLWKEFNHKNRFNFSHRPFNSTYFCQRYVYQEVVSDCFCNFSENTVLQGVIKQMSVKIGWWIGSLPGYGVCECLIERDQFTVSQFLTNTCGIEEEILVRIQLLHEALGKTLLWKRDDASLPSCHLANRLNPFVYGQCGFIAHVVDAACGTRICDGQDDSCSSIGHIASGPAPTSIAFAQDDGRTLVIHTLEILKESMLFITWSIHHREA